MGVFFALSIIAVWAGHLFYALERVTVDYSSPLFYLHILLQTYFFTGLFITGHDSMHGTVSRNSLLNKSIGFFSVFLYAGMWYPRLLSNHHLHHKFPGTNQDPDYSSRSQNYWVWYGKFMFKYLTIIQLVIMAVLYNVLRIWYADSSLIWFWVVPAVLSTFQLFYFGTYLPHKRPHTDEMEPHNARTLKKNHIWAMLSCYFFGYHHEHHTSPGIPWWKLYKAKSARP
jgi:beta-carotene ketolase (CrtW type)